MLREYKGYSRGLYTRTTGAQTMLCRTVITVGIKGVSGDQGGSKIRVTRGRDQGRDLGGSIGSMIRCQGRSGEDPGKIHEIQGGHWLGGGLGVGLGKD